MKQYLKVYGVTVICSALFILTAWGLEFLGVFNGIDVLEWQGILFALMYIGITFTYGPWTALG